MKTSNLVRVITAVLILSALTVLGIVLLGDRSHEFRKVQSAAPVLWAGPFRVQVEIDPEKPRIGKNRITIIVRNRDEQPVHDADVTAIAQMPAMGAMPAMAAPAELNSESPGVYRGQFELPMDGAWPMTLEIQSDNGERAELTFDLATSRKGLRLIAATPSGTSAESPPETNAAPRSKQPKTFQVDSHRRQLIGVTTGTVERKQLTQVIRAAGKVSVDETRKTDISLKFDGWIGELSAGYLGAPVIKGQALFTVYSPALVSAQDEYLDTLKRKQSGSNRLQEAARRRLALWDISPAQVRALEKHGKASKYLRVPSPVTGTVIEKKIVAGSAVTTGARLLRIADLSTVWVEGQIYESELSRIRVGMDAEVTLPELRGRSIPAKVMFIEPYLQGDTRTARVRVELPSPQGILRPEMYAQINLKVDLGERLVVAEEAVIYAGESRIVFLDLGDGRLMPRKIETGLRNADFIEVIGGLRAGDVVVTSGNFLISSESKLKAGIDQW
jgi:membrane fusion protein, copper/silver efflux system